MMLPKEDKLSLLKQGGYLGERKIVLIIRERRLRNMDIKYIRNWDDKWHPMDVEMPPTTTKVELLKEDGSIIIGQIIVEPSGFYIYLIPGWASTKDFTHWRFRPKLPKR